MNRSRLASFRRQYQRLQIVLGRLDLLCQGTVLARQDPRRPSPGTPYYQWTRKQNQKTVTQALSKAQYQQLRRAIANHRKLEQTLRRMRTLSENLILQTTPGVKKRNLLNRKVLRAN